MAPDRITANLPSRDFDETLRFYEQLGFTLHFRNDGWMIIGRGTMQLEFYPHPKLVAAENWSSACIRVDDLDGLHAQWSVLDLPDDPNGRPLNMDMIGGAGQPRFFPVIDCNGSLLRCIDNGSV
ncbi:MAG: bleomycin resistance protein [Sulfitobacter geojensis]|jgi:hypothetical protein|uniref:bleomycin resistance protein n=1 Tax=Sulfitobacter geojensis TaxID=1342299 RepID=UPI0036DCA83F